jgi:phosphate acetyltransferase
MERKMGLNLLNEIKEKSSTLKKTIVLPESHDERVLNAAEILTKEKIVSVITLGNEDIIRSDAERLGVDLTGVRIIDPSKSDKLSDFTNIFFNLRKHKGITIELARETVARDLFFGAMMVREGMADGSFFLCFFPIMYLASLIALSFPIPMQFNLLILQSLLLIIILN